MSDTTIGKSYYELLGVPSDASTEEIHDAYREQLMETHPDVSDHADASDQTKQLIEAKDVLTDDEKRARYDRLGHDQYVNGGLTPGSGYTEERRTSRKRAHKTADSGGGTTQSAKTRETKTSRADNNGSTATDSWYGGGGSEWETDDGEAAESTWDAWNASRAYSVQGTEEGLLGSRLFPPGQSLILLSTTFLFYPILLVGTFAGPFPLLVNVVLGGCLLGVIVYLQTIPEVGIVVFGGWAVLLPVILWGVFGVSPFTVPGGIALVATVLPLGLSLLTRAVIRP